MRFTHKGVGYRLFVDNVITDRKDSAGSPEVKKIEKVVITTYYQTSGQVEAERTLELADYPHLIEEIGDKIYVWRNGGNIVSGTELTELPLVDAFLASKLVGLGFTSVEKLSAANELDIATLGRGGIDLVNSAKDYIALNGAKGEKVVGLVDAEKEQLKAEVQELKELVKSLADKKKKGE